MSDELSLDFFNDERVSEWEDRLDFVMETLSATNSYENGDLVKENGPGLLLVQLSTDSIEEYASQMELNPWEEVDEAYVDNDDIGEFYEAFENTCKQDGAVVVGSNGRIMGSNAYLEPPPETKYQTERMQGSGAKHISAARISTLDELVYAKALSSTDGGITTFVDGNIHKVKEREDFKDKWYDTEE